MNKFRLFEQTFKALKDNGIKIVLALSGDDDLIKRLEKSLGMKIKQTDLQTKFFVVDRKEILFYLSKSGDREDLAIWLNSEFFSQAFSSLFETALNASK